MTQEILTSETMSTKFLRGSPILIEPSMFIVTPLTVGEIVDYGVEEYFGLTKVVCMTKEDIIKIHHDESWKTNDLNVYQYICVSMIESNEFSQTFKKAFRLHTGENIHALSIGDKVALLVGKIEDKKIFPEDVFLTFQNVVRAQNALPVEYEITDEQAKKRARFDEIRKKRDEIKKKQESELDDGSGLADLISTVAVLSRQPLESIFSLTYYALLEQFTRYMQLESYTSSQQFIMHGADSKKIKIQDYTGAIRPYEHSQ